MQVESFKIRPMQHLTLLLCLVPIGCRSARVSLPVYHSDISVSESQNPADQTDASSVQGKNSVTSGQGGDPKAGKLTWIGELEPKANPNLLFNLPLMVKDRDSIIISRSQYIMSWNPKIRGLNWVAWLLRPEDIGTQDRSKFAIDRQLDTLLRDTSQRAVEPGEYTGTCFDRGHQVPSKDRTKDRLQNESVFLMSNMIPQTAFLNRVIWMRLEEATRRIFEKKPNTRLWIIAGPIFDKKLKFIGKKSDIALAKANFKIIVDLGSSDAEKAQVFAAVVMPNVTSKGTDPLLDMETTCNEGLNSAAKPTAGTSADWPAYLSSLATIEEQAGLDLAQLKAKL